MANIRVAIVTYHNEELTVGDGGESIGYQVDKFIFAELKEGGLVQEVTVEFDVAEQHLMRSSFEQATDEYVKPRNGKATKAY